MGNQLSMKSQKEDAKILFWGDSIPRKFDLIKAICIKLCVFGSLTAYGNDILDMSALKM